MNSIVCSVYNQLHFTRRCFDSLISGATTPQEFIIIDNHCTDETPQYLSHFKSQAEAQNWIVKIITNTKNIGTSAAWNQGLQLAKGAYVGVLSNDTWIAPGWDLALPRMCSQLNAGMVGPYYDESFFNEKLTPKKAQKFIEKNKKRYIKKWCSIFMYFNKKILDQIGYFDERFFITYEDRDLRERMERAKIPYFQIGGSFIWHHSKGTRDAQDTKDLRPDYEQESLKKFIEKWGFDPRVDESRWITRYKNKWTQLKNKFGYL